MPLLNRSQKGSEKHNPLQYKILHLLRIVNISYLTISGHYKTVMTTSVTKNC